MSPRSTVSLATMATTSEQGGDLGTQYQAVSGEVASKRRLADRTPDKKTFIATLSGGAFVVGVVGATAYGLRKARIQALKEAQELAAAGTSASSAPASGSIASTSAASTSTTAAPSVLRRKRAPQHDLPVAPPIEAEQAPQQSAFSLFKQMNASILSPRKSAQSVAPVVNAPRSVFDDGDTSSASLPSALRRRQPAPSAPPRVSAPIMASSSSREVQAGGAGAAAIDGAAIDYSEMDSTLDFLGLSSPIPKEEQDRMKQYEEENQSAPNSFGQTPVGLSIKAFLIATGIVTFTAVAVVETTKRVLGVDSMDGFVVAMSRVVPGRREVGQRLGQVAPHMRTTREQDIISSSDLPATKPKSVDEALEELSNATSVQDWVHKLKTQLDAERDEEVRRRFAGFASTNNDAVSPSSGSYPIYSVNELPTGDAEAKYIRIRLGISPLLPVSAFAVGMVSGFLTAGKRAGLVFMAENAHRLPDTVQGWYFYSKTKNYKVMLGAVKGGLKQGTRLGIWVTAFCMAERSSEIVRNALLREFSSDRDRAAKIVGHWADGALAGLGTASAAAVLYRLPKPAVLRVFQLGLAAGAFAGGMRDLQEHLVHKEVGGIAKHT